MDEAKADSNIGTQQIPEATAFINSLDIVFLTLIIGAIGWYLVSKHKKTTTIANGRSYSIQ